MTRDFWLGLLALPLLVAGVSAAVISVLGAVWAWANWGKYRVTPIRWRDPIAAAAALVSTGRWVRLIQIPGLYVAVCRVRPQDNTRDMYSLRMDEEFLAVHASIQVALAELDARRQDPMC